MSDFLKIFFVLCGLVFAFVFGRNYGESTVVQSKEYIKMRSDSAQTESSSAELLALKAKFQDLLDSSDLKKADEVLSKIMTIFLADLSLHLTESKEKDLSFGKAQCAARALSADTENLKKTETDAEAIVTSSAREQIKKEERALAKMKSLEWILVHSDSDADIRRNLKRVELKNLDTYLKGAPATDLTRAEKFIGSYRGTIKDLSQKEYGQLYIDLEFEKNNKNEKSIRGKIELHRGGRSESSSSFSSQHFGYSPEGLAGTVYSLGGRLLQIYFIESTQKLAGYLYERLPNGTTNTIGHFVLSRRGEH